MILGQLIKSGKWAKADDHLTQLVKAKDGSGIQLSALSLSEQIGFVQLVVKDKSMLQKAVEGSARGGHLNLLQLLLKTDLSDEVLGVGLKEAFGKKSAEAGQKSAKVLMDWCIKNKKTGLVCKNALALDQELVVHKPKVASHVIRYLSDQGKIKLLRVALGYGVLDLASEIVELMGSENEKPKEVYQAIIFSKNNDFFDKYLACEIRNKDLHLYALESAFSFGTIHMFESLLGDRIEILDSACDFTKHLNWYGLWVDENGWLSDQLKCLVLVINKLAQLDKQKELYRWIEPLGYNFLDIQDGVKLFEGLLEHINVPGPYIEGTKKTFIECMKDVDHAYYLQDQQTRLISALDKWEAKNQYAYLGQSVVDNEQGESVEACKRVNQFRL